MTKSIQWRLKRFLDVLLALLALVVLSPLLVVVYGLVAYKLGRPVFFSQVRPGLKGRPFTMIKFRTMTDERDDTGQLLPNAQRLTTFGTLLRRTSLDELPELVNVLRGEMSLVGPRPLRLDYLEHYLPREMRRHDVPPGITGWAQVNGRNALSWDDKINYDLWYVDNWSLALDIRVLLLTVRKVFDRQGVREGGGVAMPPSYRPQQGSSDPSPESKP
jgi:lipopolysaccharide/colanic/teichoic acid biosynthesis glycosyltransferase